MKRHKGVVKVFWGQHNNCSSSYQINKNEIYSKKPMEPFESKAIGSQADMAATVDISKVYGGYFANPENARLFNEIGLERIEANLPHTMLYVDFGGGQGALTKSTTIYLQEKGHVVRAIVADGNPDYLQKAKSEGLETVLCNLEDAAFRDVDLVTMRAVLHYNSLENQKAILKSVFAALKGGGYFVHQVSSGSDVNSQLRSSIVNIPELGRSGSGNYHWTSINETLALHRNAGFASTELAGFAPPNSWGPEEQWDRFNSRKLDDAKALNDKKTVVELEKKRYEYLKQARSVIQDYAERFSSEETGIEIQPDGSFLINYQYPIIISCK